MFYPFLLEGFIHLYSSFQSAHPPRINFEKVLPIVYHPNYNITFCGLEKLHPFDSEKYGRIFSILKSKGAFRQDHVSSKECPRQYLKPVHPFWYLALLSYSLQVTRFVEVPLCLVPGPLLRMRVLKPMLYATYGSILAGVAAVERGWGINLSGGYHHCCSRNGGGFCIYADITLAIYWLRKWYPNRVSKVMIIDLDAHQGNGHERDFIDDEEVFIIDFFNDFIYPGDTYARRAIKYAEHIAPSDTDDSYLEKLNQALEVCIERFRPSLVVYNAGTDCMEGDPLGGLNLTENGIVRRDEAVFKHCLESSIPIAMVLSGGYQQSNAPAIADSVENLLLKFSLF